MKYIPRCWSRPCNQCPNCYGKSVHDSNTLTNRPHTPTYIFFPISHQPHQPLERQLHSICRSKRRQLHWILPFNPSWTIMKGKCQKPDAFELWCERRLSRVPWVAWRSNQSILQEINPDAEALILWSPDAKSRLTGKDPDAGKNWGQQEKRATEDEMVGWYHWQWTWVWANSRRQWRTEKPGVL